MHVFVSYSHKDEVWFDQLAPHLNALANHIPDVTIETDRGLQGGDDFGNEIQAMMERADVAVLLCSSRWLASEYVKENELPVLQRRQQEDGLTLIPVRLERYDEGLIQWLQAIQAIPGNGKWVVPDFRQDPSTPFGEVSTRIRQLPRPAPYPPENKDLTRLPPTGSALFGREKELEMLDTSWSQKSLGVLVLVAKGGVGKTTLVNEWLEKRMEKKRFRGAGKVFGFSFHSQGSGTRITDSDEFVRLALEFFGDNAPAEGTPWSKGERLAGLVRARNGLLILDGLEPLQQFPEPPNLAIPIGFDAWAS
ncbi:MAG: TIR domain-containing protein [Thermodesulfobacteriota bacterium]